tara:strand:- start:1564 stop:1953 length:390 start_codon:yes stop_codon:yes gene_type:complete
MTSVLNVDTIADKAGTGTVALTKQTTIKAFCQAPANNESITSSFNISTLNDVGPGNNQPNLTNSMSASDFPSMCSNNNNNVDNGDSAPTQSSGANSSSQYENNVGYVNSSGNMVINDYANYSIATGDLA